MRTLFPRLVNYFRPQPLPNPIDALRQQLKGAQYALVEAQQNGDTEHAENLVEHIQYLCSRINTIQDFEALDEKMARWKALERRHGYYR